MKTLKSFLSSLFLPILLLFLLNSCSDVKSEKSGNKEFEKCKKSYIKAHAGTEKEKEAIDGMISFSSNYETARYSWEVVIKAKSLNQEQEERAIKKMEKFAQTSEEVKEVQKAKKIFDENFRKSNEKQ